ncbi:MAG TPA: UDP-glucose/GDP-mannose dehydrogenase family protein [Saprospiraceae bacterium]|nr:UDP-glucose/GDP-mannose dehydrogenase family protein [Lewinellaceae bacterium]HQU60457.1 UDP-glucose/GDP-mannose dehydrogenase family protein [Saprospiraceae bacterium]
MKIAVFGTGYVGLVTAVGLANTGKKVICIDNDLEKVEKIRKGISPIYEPGLDALLLKNLERLAITSNAADAITASDVIIIAVGTPFDGNRIDLSYIRQAAREIGEAIKNTDDYKVVVVKSTVVPDTTMGVVRPIVLEHSGKQEEEVGFCMNPEFLREGNAVEDFLDPDRIVLGVSSPEVEAMMREVYDGYRDSAILITNPTTAEMIKYTANSFLALTISFSNEIARICENLPGVDSEEVFNGVIHDKRFSPIIGKERITPQLASYLRAGVGFGGSCFPKDVKALRSFSKGLKVDGKLLDGLLHINETQLEHVFSMGLKKFSGKARRIAVLGTAFKPNTDDVRESPGVKLAQMALGQGIQVAVQDYVALSNTKALLGAQVEYYDDPLEAVEGADIVFVTTIWPQYLDISEEDFEKHMPEQAIMVDTRSHFKERKAKKWRHRIGVGQPLPVNGEVEYSLRNNGYGIH